MVFFFKQKTAYEMRISDWSSDVCSFRSKIENCRAAPTSGAGRLSSEENNRPPTSGWRILRSPAGPEGSRVNRPISDPKAAAPCWRPEGRSGMTHEETEASPKPLAPLADREPEDPPPSEWLLRRADNP